MSEPFVPPPGPPRGPGATRHGRGGWVTRSDLRAGVLIVAALAALGVLLGVVWHLWNPAGARGFVLGPHAVAPEESEAWIAADGRFAALTGAAGLGAGVVVWLRTGIRGPVAALGLALGAGSGSLLTEWIGHLLGGGRSNGPTGTVLPQLPTAVHMTGLRVVEAAAAVLVYGVFAAFAVPDDLGRPDREPGSVEVRPDIGDGTGRDGNAAGALQQHDLAS